MVLRVLSEDHILNKYASSNSQVLDVSNENNEQSKRLSSMRHFPTGGIFLLERSGSTPQFPQKVNAQTA